MNHFNKLKPYLKKIIIIIKNTLREDSVSIHQTCNQIFVHDINDYDHQVSNLLFYSQQRN